MILLNPYAQMGRASSISAARPFHIEAQKAPVADCAVRVSRGGGEGLVVLVFNLPPAGKRDRAGGWLPAITSQRALGRLRLRLRSFQIAQLAF